MYISMHVSKYPLSNVLFCVIVYSPFQSLFSSPRVSLKSSSCLFILNFFISSLYPTLKHTCIFLLFLSVPSHLLCLLNPCLFPSLSSFFFFFFSPLPSATYICAQLSTITYSVISFLLIVSGLVVFSSKLYKCKRLQCTCGKI